MRGEGGPQLVQRRVGTSTQELAEDSLVGLCNAPASTASMGRRPHRARLSCETQNAVHRGTPHSESLCELIIALALLDAGFDDSDPQIIRDGCSHALVKAQERLRAAAHSCCCGLGSSVWDQLV